MRTLICLFSVITQLVLVDSVSAQDPRDLGGKKVSNAVRVVNGPGQNTNNICEIDPSLFEGSWTIYDGLLGLQENLNIRMFHTPIGEFLVDSDINNPIFDNYFIASCNNGKQTLKGTFDNHDCKHTITITRIENRGDEPLMVLPGSTRFIEIKTSHGEGKGCAGPHELHAGVVHGGGSGTN